MKQITFLFSAAVLIAWPAVAQDKAETPVEVAKYNAWTVYRLDSSTGRSCYAVTQPARSEPPNAKRDPAYFFITHRPKENVRNEISASMGYPLKANSAGSLTILDGEKFLLAGSGEGVFLADAAKEDMAVAAMRKRREVTIKAISKRGTSTTDRYSLNGIGKALDHIDRECPKT